MLLRSSAARTARRSLVLGLVLLVLAAPSSLPVAAQGVGTIRGIVVDVNGKPIKGATVKSKGGSATALTDSGGLFVLKVKPGTHDVTATMKGFAPDTARGAEVKAGAIKDVSLVLVPAG